jgi:hypothetical protein
MGDINNNVAWPNAEEIQCPHYTGIAAAIAELMALSDGSISTVAAGYAVPVTSLTDTGVKATNQYNLAQAFLGLSHQQKMTTDATGTVLVSRSAVRQMSCNALLTAAKVGDMVAGSVLTATGGTALSSMLVEVTTNATYAIGRVIGAAAAGSTTLKVLFSSNVVPATINAGSTAINTAANLTITGNLAVNGTTSHVGDLTETGNATVTGTLTATGNASFGNFISAKAAALTATGTVIGNAAAIIAQANAITGATNTGVQLPAIASGKAKPIFVRGDPTNAILVYPAVNCTIDGGAVNTAVSMAAAEKRVFFSDGAINHMSIKSA